jgi:hypothetical protein
MSNIEDQLRDALRRHDPPPGLVDRVLERTRLERAERVEPAPPPRRMWRPLWRPLWSMAAIAATLTVVSLSVTTYQHTREERAARQAELALRIASEKLNLARNQIVKNLVQKDY